MLTRIYTLERAVLTFPLDALDPRDPMAGVKRAKRIASHISFFKAGVCLGRTLVCVVKASALSSTIKVLEPIDTQTRGRNKPTFKKILQGGNDTLRHVKVYTKLDCRASFLIPTSRNSISPSNQARSISSRLSFVLAARMDSKLWTWNPLILRAY